jgi:hypothetical protein
MDYDWQNIPPFLGFDIFNIKECKFLNNADKIYKFIGFDSVPEIGVAIDLVPIYTDDNMPKSAFASPSAKNQQAEGVVYKNYEKQLFAKLVRSGFKEKNKEAFGASKKWADTDSERIVAKYCTNARIDKSIFKLIDDGHKLEIQMMRELPKKVYRDIWEEEWQEIIMTQYIINFREIRKLINKRCKAVLEQMITNNALRKSTGNL